MIIAAIVVGTIWLMWVVWQSPHRSDLATFGAFAAAVLTIAAGLIAWAKNIGPRRHGGESRQRELDHIADLLGVAVKDQWTGGLGSAAQPEPIPVRWQGRPSCRSRCRPPQAHTEFPPLRASRDPATRSPERTAMGFRYLEGLGQADDHRRHPGIGKRSAALLVLPP